MILEFLTASFSSVITLSPSIRVIRYSVSLVSKIWFDSFPKFSIIGYSIHMEIIVENLLRFPQKLNTKISLSFMGKEISSTIIFLYLLRRRVQVVIAFLSHLFMKGDWLHLTCFFFFWPCVLSTFEEMYLNSPG